ncbi:hypothetical protein [Sedimenticola selenatireducens]|jgi:hypothetical protein|uniref:HAMP domain-containing protein n=1 Tax=Sedimenticola selenatireducens TaxID=191960 RepID=A0A558DWZ4_9GAMM|nr:hypothetical protein [Sedimenticola selenatireducens]MDF1528098.1 hypothetical protein [Sedimenticola sp.]TVO71633.1 hypothetical protein FHP88_13960 [Sedimenticola selenatireducens]TVT65547.1 MAG: hypothetical protein FHK78_03965 [Sedimenticola selenatireducens]
MSKGTVKMSMRMVLSVSLIVFGVLAGYLALHYVDARAELIKSLTGVAESTASRLSKQIAAPLWSINEQQVNATINSEMSQSELSAIEVIDPVDSRVLFQKVRESGRSGFLLSERDAVVMSKEVLTDAGEHIGTAVVHISLPFMKARLTDEMSKRAIELAILGIILIFAYLLILQLFMVMPLRHAAQAVRSTSVNELNDLIQSNRNGELGGLLYALDDLQKRLRMAHNQSGH